MNMIRGAGLFAATASVALFAIGTANAQAFSFTTNFDSVASGTLVNTLFPSQLRADPTAFLPDLDEFNNPIPGTERFRVDPDAPPVPVTNTFAFNGVAAPSPNNAMGDRFSAIQLTLTDPTLIFTSFGITLDNDTFGTGLAEQFLFLDANGATLLAVGIDQSVPGQIFLNSALPGFIRQIILPSGAFYDNMTISASVAPEPGTLALATVGLSIVGGIAVRRRRRVACGK